MCRRLLAGAVLLSLSSAAWAGSAGGSGGGVDATDAVNKVQLDAATQQAIEQANHYADSSSAMSVGYGEPIGERVHIGFGATSSGSESSAGFGFGVDL